jgi:methyltransferase (TIGR00027 family)
MAQNSPHKTIPDHTAVRVALWRALHLEVDAVPYVLKDNVGAQIVGEEGWRNRPDMDPQRFIGPRASIVGRARLIEDVLEELVQRGVGQYVILGAGLDTFGQRRSDLGAHLNVFEIDQPETQKWKKNRLSELGFKIPEWLKFVPVDFEAGESWIEQVEKAGFDKNKPAFVVSTGVSMYLTKEANLATLKQMASLAPASVFAMTFMLPLELLEPQDRPLLEFTIKFIFPIIGDLNYFTCLVNWQISSCRIHVGLYTSWMNGKCPYVWW